MLLAVHYRDVGADRHGQKGRAGLLLGLSIQLRAAVELDPIGAHGRAGPRAEQQQQPAEFGEYLYVAGESAREVSEPSNCNLY